MIRFEWKKLLPYFFTVLGTVLLLWIIQQVFFKKKSETFYEQQNKRSELIIKQLQRDTAQANTRIKAILKRTAKTIEDQNEKFKHYVEENEGMDFSGYSDPKLDSTITAILSKY